MPPHTQAITNWACLERYGVFYLTSEECGLQYRVTCDFNATGRKLLRDVLGLPDISLNQPWNNSKGDRVGSALLPFEMLTPLGVLALLTIDKFPHCYVLKAGGAIAYPADMEEAYLKLFKDDHERCVPAFRHSGPQSSDGLRNVHLMTGRNAE